MNATSSIKPKKLENSPVLRCERRSGGNRPTSRNSSGRKSPFNRSIDDRIDTQIKSLVCKLHKPEMVLKPTK